MTVLAFQSERPGIPPVLEHSLSGPLQTEFDELCCGYKYQCVYM
jgi:hypothetical protein